MRTRKAILTERGGGEGYHRQHHTGRAIRTIIGLLLIRIYFAVKSGYWDKLSELHWLEAAMMRALSHWTTMIGQWVGHPVGLALIIIYAFCWFFFSPSTFEWNAVATLAVWIMTVFIQRSSRRDTLAIHAKLDELLRSHEKARDELADLDEKEPEDIEEHRRSEKNRPS